MEWVVREHINNQWVSTYFQDSTRAHRLFRKILRAGGVAICLRSGF